MGKKLGKKSPAFKCHRKYFQQAKATADVLVVENVPQYQCSTVEEELGEDWKVRSCIIDPRIVGLPAARSRIYLICYNKKVAQWRSDITLESVLGALTSRVITDASMYLWMELQPGTLSASQETHTHTCSLPTVHVQHVIHVLAANSFLFPQSSSNHRKFRGVMKSYGFTMRSFRREISRSTTRTPATRAKCFRISTNWPETTGAVQSWSMVRCKH